jgi:Leucine-rich repeat (LRR) protein
MGNWLSTEQTSSLDFSHNNGNIHEVLSKMSESDLSRFKSLAIADCDLEQIPDEVLTLVALEDLNISWNKIKDITPLASMQQLCVLDCSGNPMTALPPEIGDLVELEILTVCKAKLENLPVELSKLTRLKELGLFTNKIVAVPDNFLRNMSSLTELNMACNQLESLPSDMFNSTSLLRRLILYSNHIQTLPSLRHLAKLEQVQLQGNRFSIMPDLGCHHCLTELDLSHNALKELPTSLFERDNFPVLATLQLTSNGLTSIPANIASLPSLTLLGVANNQLTELPLPIYRMQTLAHLDISRNKFTKFPDDLAFLQFMLVSLYISHNALTTLPAVLSLFTRLRAFSVTGNPVNLLDPTTAETYTSIRYNVQDRKKGKFMGLSPADEITEAEYWKSVWGEYDPEWQGLL